MKKVETLICLCLFVSKTTVFAEEIKIGYFLWPPMIEAIENQTKPGGIIIKHYEDVIAEKLGVTFKWMGPYSIPRTVAMIKRHEIDMIPLQVKTPDREKIMAFPKKPLYTMKAVICVKKDFWMNKPEILKTWDDLMEIKMGINSGSAFSKTLLKSHPQLQLAQISHWKDPVRYALKLVLNNKLPAYIHPDKFIIKIIIKRLKLEKDIKILAAPAPERYTYTAISLKKSKLLKKYNEHIDEITIRQMEQE